MVHMPGMVEILVLLLVLVVLFGPSRVPDLARSLGQSHHAFRTGLRGGLQDPAELGAPATGEAGGDPAPEPGEVRKQD